MAIVLIATSDRELSGSLGPLLTRRGHNVNCAGEPGQLALGPADRPWHVMFIDLDSVPEGLSWIGVEHSLECRVDVVAVGIAGKACSMERVRRLLGAGAAEFLLKPLRDSEVEGVVERLGL